LFLADTNVLLDVLGDDPSWGNWSVAALGTALGQAEVSINPIIYAELSASHDSIEALDQAIDRLRLRRLNLPYAAAFLAGRAFVQYRRAGGAKTAPLPDFYIGAHATVAGLTVLTRDPAPFRTYFPKVGLIAP
jgi:predicted nucleic acid-binding protein